MCRHLDLDFMCETKVQWSHKRKFGSRNESERIILIHFSDCLALQWCAGSNCPFIVILEHNEVVSCYLPTDAHYLLKMWDNGKVDKDLYLIADSMGADWQEVFSIPLNFSQHDIDNLNVAHSKQPKLQLMPKHSNTESMMDFVGTAWDCPGKYAGSVLIINTSSSMLIR